VGFYTPFWSNKTPTKIVKFINSYLYNFTNIQAVDLHERKSLGPYETGELCIKSPYHMIEYIKNPEETKETIDSEGWLRSGGYKCIIWSCLIIFRFTFLFNM